jgi:pyruvate-formate lyase-activating enzyme
MKSEIEKAFIFRDEMDEIVSETFCLAKWHHTTIYLQTGMTHSCYHPAPHKIPLEGLAENPSQLHNTPHKKEERKQMLNGEKPSGCQYCWNVECLGKDYVSDRVTRSASLYQEGRVAEILNNDWDFDVNPDYIEVAFSNECNFKCGYCHPNSSSSFMNEIKKHGPYDMVENHRLDIDWFKAYEEDDNPYVKAWWAWWPEVSKTLNILRVTGGEPLMHKSTWRLFDELRENPKPHLELNINTNLGVKTSLVEKLAENANDITSNNKVKQFAIYTSIDSWNPRAEYIRTGLDLELWEKNLDTYARTAKTPINLMITFNALTVTTFKSLLEKILEWRKKYDGIIIPTSISKRIIRFDTPYLKEPLHYDMNILPKEEFMPYMTECLSFIFENVDDDDPTMFQTVEFEKFRRVHDYMKTTIYDEEKLNQGRKDFYNWFNEYDRRRDTNFLETFPEYENFYNRCSRLSR